jgi:dihydroorotate dehydrogenase
MSPADAVAKLKVGAHLVQLYTGFVYEGPGLLPAILKAIR